MKTVKNKNQKLKTGLLGVAGMLLLSFPFVSIPNKPKMICSVPVLYLYVFGIWLVLIVGVFLISEQIRRKPKKGTE